jgi:hypothetical protein
MGARELLHELEAAGINVAVDGHRLVVRPASKLSAPHRIALRDAKFDVIALLSSPIGYDEDDTEAFEERAAIMEFDGRLTRAQAEAAARKLLLSIAAMKPKR